MHTCDYTRPGIVPWWTHPTPEEGIMRGNGKINAFGQRVLVNDYGADDLNRHRDDLRLESGRPVIPGGAVAIAVPRQDVEGILAVLDATMPAKTTVWERLTDFDVTREPDLLDEVEAAWIGEDMVLVVPVERLDDFRAYVATHGLSPCGRGAFKLHLLTRESADLPVWDAVESCVRA